MVSIISEAVRESLKLTNKATLRSVAAILNKRKLKSFRDGAWHASTVNALLDRLGKPLSAFNPVRE